MISQCDYARSRTAESPYETVRALVESMICRLDAEDRRQCIMSTFDSMCSSSLRQYLSERAHRQSVITLSGVPFEVSFTTADRPGTVRFLSEAASADQPLPVRVACALDCLTTLTAALHLAADGAVIDHLLKRILPPNLADFDDTWANGAIWISTRFARGAWPVLRVYVNQQWNNNAFRFLNAARLFDDLHQPHNSHLLPRVFSLTDGWANLTGISFDIGSAIGGVKLYFGVCPGATRQQLLSLLRRINLDAGDVSNAISFLDVMKLRDSQFVTPSLLVSLGFPQGASGTISVKMDATTRIIFDSDREVFDSIEDLLRLLRVHAFGYRACEDLFFPDGFPAGPVRILQYVGLALSAAASSRLNIYLAPPIR